MLRQFEYFKAVAKHLNFTKAAHECNISQSAMSQQIENLEDTIGIKLFNRNSRITSLTPAGDIFLRHVNNILDIYINAVNEAKQVENQNKQMLSIGYSGPWENFILPQIVSAYNKAEPNVILKFEYIPLNSISTALLNKSIDLAFAAPYNFDADDNLNVITLAESPINIVVNKNHSFANMKTVNKKYLKSQTFLYINNSMSVGLQKKAKRIFQLLEIDPAYTKVQTQTDLDSVILLVKSGLGITILPKAIKGNFNPMDLSFIDIEDIDEKFNVGVAWLKGDVTNKSYLNNFILFLKNNIGNNFE
ncbi:MAG: LysR family transcriptional regulator [Youngiibacter sp.]|nr:LysR family transcriptional regulator [Youngiibacter sp.]